MGQALFLTVWFGSEPCFIYVVGSAMCSSAFLYGGYEHKTHVATFSSRELVLRSRLEPNCVRVLIFNLMRGWILQCVGEWLRRD